MPAPARVLIVDDSTFVRRAVERMLSGMPEIQVVGTAVNGAEAIERVRALRPDVVVMDVNMPKKNGLDALRQIMSECPTGVLMLSTLTTEGADTTLRALELGAIDFIDKMAAGNTMDIYALAPLLREKILTVAGASIPRAVTAIEEAHEEPEPVLTSSYELLVIGASTGGPRALAQVLAPLPRGYPMGIVVAQHMPPGFTDTLADRLNQRCRIEVREARDGDRVDPGVALIAPGGRHITVQRSAGRLHTRITAGEAGLLHRPSVDLLFRSAAEAAGDRTIGLILTGMGDDGARGLAELKAKGARTLAESEATAVIYGMPKAAAASAERILSLPEIGAALAAMASHPSTPEAPS